MAICYGSPGKRTQQTFNKCLLSECTVHCSSIQPLSGRSWRAPCSKRSLLKEEEVSGPWSLSPSSAAEHQFSLLASVSLSWKRWSPRSLECPWSNRSTAEIKKTLSKQLSLGNPACPRSEASAGRGPPGLPPEQGTGCVPSHSSCCVSASAHPQGLVVAIVIVSLPGLPKADGSSWR